MFDFRCDVFVEAFGERPATSSVARPARPCAISSKEPVIFVGDLYREQKSDAGGYSHYGHELAHRLDAQVAPVEHHQGE